MRFGTYHHIDTGKTLGRPRSSAHLLYHKSADPTVTLPARLALAAAAARLLAAGAAAGRRQRHADAEADAAAGGAGVAGCGAGYHHV